MTFEGTSLFKIYEKSNEWIFSMIKTSPELTRLKINQLAEKLKAANVVSLPEAGYGPTPLTELEG